MSRRLADMHIPPAFRRWGIRLVLAIVVAVAIGYLPGEILRRDPRAAKLAAQLDDLATEERALIEQNASLARQIEALSTEVRAVEGRARSLGLVYPGEVVIRVEAAP